jgi:hypothetical protein
MDEKSSGWKTKTILIGGILGLLIGVIAAFLFVKNQPEDAEPRKLSSKQGMQLGLGVVSVIRQIVDLGTK